MAPKSKNKKVFSTGISKKPIQAPKTVSTDPPLPFRRAPTTLEPFLSQLDTSHVYIAHVDSTDREFKRKIFMVPVAMNIALIALFVWRIYVIGPYYMKVFFTMLGMKNETSMDISEMATWNEAWLEVAKRFSKFIIDFLLYMWVFPWPKDFFAGNRNGSPILWRIAVGFRDKEIIVRRSRKWDQEIGDVVPKGADGEDEGSKTFGLYIRQAVAPSYMYQKTGYLMMNKEWDLDWKLMAKATKLVDNKTLTLHDFKTTILVHSPDFGWVVESADASDDIKEEQGRKKIIAFKDKLTAMGKENLFFRWIELVQYESAKPEGFGPDRQAEVMKQAKQMFEEQGVDFEAFWAEIGGMEGLPGMDQL